MLMFVSSPICQALRKLCVYYCISLSLSLFLTFFLCCRYRSGDIAMLQVDAVVNPTNESLTDKNPISIRLLEVAGPELKDACKTQIGSESWRHIHTHTGIRTFICVYVHTLCMCSLYAHKLPLPLFPTQHRLSNWRSQNNRWLSTPSKVRECLVG